MPDLKRNLLIGTAIVALSLFVGHIVYNAIVYQPEIGQSVREREVRSTTTIKKIDDTYERIQGKTHREKSLIKREAVFSELSKRDSDDYIAENGVRLQVIDIEKIEKGGEYGIAVFARAWYPDGRQVGFGKDGTVDIERFIIYNPRTLVKDEEGDIYSTTTKPDGSFLRVNRYRSDIKERTLQEIADNIRIVGKSDNNIVEGKVGETTSTFYSVAGANYPVDGWVQHTGSAWTTAHDATTGTAVSTADTQNNIYTRRVSGTNYHIQKSQHVFKTSSIGSDDIDSATVSQFNEGTNSDDNDGRDYIRAIEGSIATSSNVTTADYDACGNTDNPPRS